MLLNNNQLSYQIYNPRIPVTFLHAFPLNLDMWNPQFVVLKRNGIGYIAMDYPGFGKSKIIKQSMSMDDYADWICNLMRNLGITRSIFVGSSMGGYVAFAILRKYPELIQGLVLANTRASEDNEENVQRRMNMVSDLKKNRDTTSIVENYLSKFLTSSTRKRNPSLVNKLRSMMAEAVPDAIIQAQKAMAGRKNSFDLLKNLNIPVLVIAGTKDELITVSEAQEMASCTPYGELRIIQNAAHISNLEVPKKFNEILINFLKQSNP